MIVTKISFSQLESKNSLKRRDTALLYDARTAGVKEKLKKEAVAFGDNYCMGHAPLRYNGKAPARINIFKLSGAYYFKHFFDDLELFRELEPYYEKARYRFRMATAGERNKVMWLLDRRAMRLTS